uniref:Nuclear pore protein n=1 Tax=Albugo laibachii Nc14 TaxID=890382 RepID=F0WUV2_9STRA|nr:nuclear pore complex protein Nup93like protein putat [Albugo laibachii Nc14]|eukprot:CCA25188.1 nuclear pore complex protein Nup93like protein putat [Albugo laibachii Nc14]
MDFKTLYENSLKLTTSINETEIPPLVKGLDQLEQVNKHTFKRQSRQIADNQEESRHKLQNHAIDDKATFLLASKGLDTHEIFNDLQNLQHAIIEPRSKFVGANLDLKSHLSKHHERILFSSIDQSNRQTIEFTHDSMNQAIVEDYEHMKQQILYGTNERGLVTSDRSRYLVNSSNGQDRNKAVQNLEANRLRFSGMDAPLRISHLQSEISMSQEMKAYYKVIKELMMHRQPQTRCQFDLVHAFERTCLEQLQQEGPGTKWEFIWKCWQLLSIMLTGHAEKSNPSQFDSKCVESKEIPGENEFSEALISESQLSSLRRRLAFGALLFLENQYRVCVQQTVTKYQLATGGVLGLLPNLRAFVEHVLKSSCDVSLSQRSSESQSQLWAVIYYGLRCGAEEEIVEYVADIIKSGQCVIDENVLKLLQYRAELKKANIKSQSLRISPVATKYPEEYKHLLERYRRHTSISMEDNHTVDPYELCVLNLLCFVNPNTRESRVLVTIEDYLWQRLCFINCPSGATTNSDGSHSYSVTKLAQSIQKFGPSHFEASNIDNPALAPLLYFEILLITQDFESAIKYLASKGHILEAVHFAITLNYYGLLHCAMASAGEEKDDSNLDLTRLLRQFVHQFQRSHPCEATEYYCCITDENTRQELLIELLLESRKFETLVGRMNNADGCRSHGLFDRLLRDEASVREIVICAARKAEQQGASSDAVQLYQNAGDIDAVISILNKQLSASLSAARAEREEVFRIGKEFADQWLKHPWVQNIASRYARSTTISFQTLLNFCIFLNLSEDEKYTDAIRFVEELDIFPAPNENGNSINTITMCVDRFMASEDSVRQNFHIILLRYAECLVQESNRLKAHTSSDIARVGVGILREKIALVVAFAGMIKYRLPIGTNEQLTRMESMIFF